MKKILLIVVLVLLVGCSSSNNNTVSEIITLEEAQQIALDYADVSVDDAKFYRSELDNSDNRQVFELEFIAGDLEYDFDIDAITGEIISFDQEMETEISIDNVQEITRDEALSIALADAGKSDSEVTDIDVEYDKHEDGYNYAIWSVDFESLADRRIDWEFDIKASSGEIVHRDRENGIIGN
ncbi:MAG: PepSY domain-containing protein [Erysipelotrichaceae bacterium]